MYRIRLASGEESVYRTAAELAQAVSSGAVSETAEVFHKSAGKWLPINVHPDYRAVVTGKRPASTAAPAAAAPAIQASAPTNPLAPIAAVPVNEPAATAEFIELTPAAGEPLPGAVPQFHSATGPLNRDATRAGKLRIMLALAMGLLAVASIGGAILAWPRVSPWLAAHRNRDTTLSEGMAPEPGGHLTDSTASLERGSALGAATLRLDSIPNLFPAPSRPLANLPATLDSTAPPAHEETKVSRLTATRNRAPSYFEAYADARSEMDDGLDYVSFRRIFAPSRFAAPESLRAARRMVAAAGNILRVYRGREVMLEQTYRPDDPGGRGSLREPFETAEASRALLADVDSLFGLLVSQQGRFSYGNESIRFQDSRSTRTYNQIRAEIVNTLNDWRDSTGATNRVTLPRLMQAMGGTLPPPAH
jgi:hypothetical protein